MKRRVFRMRLVWASPIVLSIARIVLTIYVLACNPFGMSLRFMQCVPLVFYLAYLFMYVKLYSDGVPIISILAPSFLHFAIVWAVDGKLQILPFVSVLVIDCLYLALKDVKANAFPFTVDGDEIAAEIDLKDLSL